MGIEFENDYKGYAGYQNFNSSGFPGNEPKGFTGWLIKKGIVKNEAGAKLLQLGVVAFNIITTIIVVVYFL
jgi:hypothetical protein